MIGSTAREVEVAGRRADRWIVIVAVGVAVLFVAALLLGAAHTAAVGVGSSGDNSTIELNTADVGTSRTPLLGQATRYDFSNPGPLQYWTLAIGYRLFGRDLSAGAAVASVIAVILVTWAISRSRSPGLVLWTLTIALVLGRSMGVELRDAWNPWMPVLWFFAYAVICWRLGTGDRAMLPAVILTGSFALQCHVQYGVVVAAVGAWGFGCWLVAERSRARTADPELRASSAAWRPVLLATAAALLLGWGAPLVEQLTADEGNVSRFIEYLGTDNGPPTFTSGAVVHELGYALRPNAPWTTGRRVPFLPYSTRDIAWLAAIVGACAAVTVVTWRRGHRDRAVLGGIALAAIAGCFVSMLTIRGAPLFYLVRFTWPVAAVVWWSLGWAAWGVLPRQIRVRAAVPAAGALTVVASGCVLALLWGSLQEPTLNRDQMLVKEIGPDILAALEPGAVVDIAGHGDAIFFGLTATAYLERHGHPVAGTIGFDGERAARVPSVRLVFVEGPNVDRFPVDPSQVLVARYRSEWADDEEGALARAAVELERCGRPGVINEVRSLHIDNVIVAIGEPEDPCADAMQAVRDLVVARESAGRAIDWTRVDAYLVPLEPVAPDQ